MSSSHPQIPTNNSATQITTLGPLLYIINSPEITTPNNPDIPFPPPTIELAALLVVVAGGEVVVVVDVLVGDVVVPDKGNDSDTLGVTRLQNRCAKSSAVPSSLGHSPRTQFMSRVGKFILRAKGIVEWLLEQGGINQTYFVQ